MTDKPVRVPAHLYVSPAQLWNPQDAASTFASSWAFATQLSTSSSPSDPICNILTTSLSLLSGQVTDFELKTTEPDDVALKITRCGACLRPAELTCTPSPVPGAFVIPGHKIIGIVTEVGKNVKDTKVGDRVAVGSQVGSCLSCPPCNQKQEQPTIRFPIPDALESTDAASMLCGGATVYSPLVRRGAGPGKRVGVVGIGGLGHYAALFGAALGAEVVAISHSFSKREDASKMGSKEFYLTAEDPKWAEKLAKNPLDLTVSTASSNAVGLAQILSTLKVHARLVYVFSLTLSLPSPKSSGRRRQTFSSSSSLLLLPLLLLLLSVPAPSAAFQFAVLSSASCDTLAYTPSPSTLN
ncbi:hypothetical protein V8E36_003427 [Tilletia maclaganii]